MVDAAGKKVFFSFSLFSFDLNITTWTEGYLLAYNEQLGAA
jgi:hypothetical protein